MDGFNFESDSNDQIHYGSINVSKSKNDILNYELNFDHDPIVIKKKPTEKKVHTQNVSLRYLRPPSLPHPGDIIVEQEPDKLTSPLSPLIIRRHFPKPLTPKPCIYREEPPSIPDIKPDQVITIPGKIIQQPRKIIIEHYLLHEPSDQNINEKQNQIHREYVNFNMMQPYTGTQNFYFPNIQPLLQPYPSLNMPIYSNPINYWRPNFYVPFAYHNYHNNFFNSFRYFNPNCFSCYYSAHNCNCT